MATLTAAACNNTCSKNNTLLLQKPSFSSYLTSKEEALVPEYSEPIQSLSPIFMNNPLYLSRKKMGGGEIGIFGAERYFNEAADEANPSVTKGTTKHQHRRDGERSSAAADPAARPPVVIPGTPSIHSDSSCNSQSVLLQNVVVRHPSRRKSSRSQPKSFLANLGCNCYCSNKKSVSIEEPASEKTEKNKIKTSSESIKVVERIDQKVKVQKEEEENGRKSSGAFGSPVLEQGTKVFSFDKRLNMINWDAAMKVQGPETQAASNDAESDASSDLFEIESFSTKLSPFLAHQESESPPGCITPTTGYAPSEASIAWSVVTASAADFSTVPDYEERRPTETSANSTRKGSLATTSSRQMGKEAQGRHPGSLLGCSSQKAVNIAGNATTRASERTNPDTRSYHRSEMYRRVNRFPAENKIAGLDKRQDQYDVNTIFSHPLYNSVA